MEDKRRGYKEKLAKIFNDNPDVSTPKIIALFSQQTGLRHAKIREYAEELSAEGRIDVDR